MNQTHTQNRKGEDMKKEKKLIIAIQEKNLKKINKLLNSKKIDVNWEDENKLSATKVALVDGSNNLLELLMEHGANPNQIIESYGKSIPILFKAILMNNFEAAKILLNHGADASYIIKKPNYNTSILSEVVECVRPKRGLTELQYTVTKLMIECNADVNAITGYYGSALISAIKEYNNTLARLFIDMGAKLNVISTNKEYMVGIPLSFAFDTRNIDLAKYMLEKGADPNFDNGIAFWNARYMSEEAIFLLLNNGYTPKDSDIISCANENYYEAGKVLLSTIKYDDKKSYLNIALECTIENKAYKYSELLISVGADVNYKDRKSSMIILATEMHYTSMVKLLIENGADINVRNNFNKSPLCIAVNKNWVDLVDLFIEKNAMVLPEDIDLLFEAVFYENTQYAKWLIEKGVNINLLVGPRNILSPAVAHNMTDLVQLLVKLGIALDVDLSEEYGNEQALSFAVYNCNFEIVKLLLENGANPNSTDEYGKSIIDYATRRGFTEIAEELEKYF